MKKGNIGVLEWWNIERLGDYQKQKLLIDYQKPRFIFDFQKPLLHVDRQKPRVINKYQ